MISIRFVVFSLYLARSVVSYEGNSCTLRDTGKGGRCISVHECDHAKKLLQSQQIPQHCGFNKQTPLVCCPHQEPTPGVTSQEQCQKYNVQLNTLIRPQLLIIIGKGKEALPKEFPHMAAVGFGAKNNTSWLCGGSLISDWFVLTAAHCVRSLDFGPAKWIRLGDLDLKSTTDDASPQDIPISQTMAHPDYKPPSFYNDIALMKLEKAATFGIYVQPACLHTKTDIPYNKLQAIGWGLTEFLGDPSSELMKVNLDLIEHETCVKRFLNEGRRLKNGVQDEQQFCAGHASGKDTCPGDSGGPLQFKERRGAKHYFVVAGVTSFGKGCAMEDSVGVYARVSQYIGWIESVVWPFVPQT